MGKRGPAPKPTAMKLLEGNPGQRKLSTNEPQPPRGAEAPKPPDHLLPYAVEEWERLAGPLWAMGVLTEVDCDAFAELCQNYAYYRITDDQIRANGGSGAYAMQESESGYLTVHPIISIRRQYYQLWTQALGQFGLTPSSRSRLSIDTGKQEVETDPMMRVISGNY